ncbi:MAG: hypothetical protein GX789_09880 [Pseudomonas formosensis]|nr:hypothetical protein [Halopseudomonas formosensis]
MTPAVDPYYPTPLHPLHALLLAGSLPLFLGTLLSDITYYNTYQIQWSNFASWLLAGALLFSGLALLCAVIGLFRRDRRQGPALMYFVMLLAAWILGFFNALIHARDAWAIMPGALVLSALVTILALAAVWLGLFSLRDGGVR